MKYKIILKKPVLKFLSRHKWQKITQYFMEALEKLQYDYGDDSLDIVKLSWYEHRYRLRIGKYRFLYRISDDMIVITFYDAGGRGDIYK